MFAAFILAASTSCVVPAQDISQQLALPYDQFDTQAGPHGWRGLNSAGCTDAAVDLLRTFANTNESELSADQNRELAFHIGQALAFAGRQAEAIAAFEHANRPGGTAEWHTYVDATIAFLKRDAQALDAARKAYAAIAPGSMRLQAIDGFVQCPEAPYSKAIHCAMQM
jgi:hypothetical protein